MNTTKKRTTKADALKKRSATLSRLKRDAGKTFSSPEGKIMLRYLYEICGYNQSAISPDAKSGEIQPYATVYFHAKREVYLELRSLLNRFPDLLSEVENNFKIEE